MKLPSTAPLRGMLRDVHPTPANRAGAGVVGVCTFSGGFCSLELVPAKWHYLSHLPVGDAHR